MVRNLVSLGAKPYVVSVVGADEMGKSLKDLLQNDNYNDRPECWRVIPGKLNEKWEI